TSSTSRRSAPSSRAGSTPSRSSSAPATPGRGGCITTADWPFCSISPVSPTRVGRTRTTRRASGGPCRRPETPAPPAPTPSTAAADGSDFSTVIVNDSEYPLTYRIDAEGFDLDGAPLAVWQTRAAEDGEAFNADYKQHVADVSPEQGSYLVQVEPYSIATVTSL